MSGSFVDTNILVYSVSEDGAKAGRAEALISADTHISVQVLNEFAQVARRKLGWSYLEIGRFLEGVRALVTVHPLTVEVHELGLRIAAHYRLAIYDAMIVAAALEAGCDVLYSEDMHHGLRLGGLTVLNPFA